MHLGHLFTCLSDSDAHDLKLWAILSLDIFCSSTVTFSRPQFLPEGISLPAPSNLLESPFPVVNVPILGHLQGEKMVRVPSDFQSGALLAM